MTLPTINRNATQFPELNTLLVELAERTRMILGGNFVGAYLQGSFAVGDADMASDCDFLIPVHGRITPEQEAALRSLHREFPERPEHWAKHLEGSYPDKDELRPASARSGCTSTMAGARCNGRHTAIRRSCAGRSANAVARSLGPSPEHSSTK